MVATARRFSKRDRAGWHQLLRKANDQGAHLENRGIRGSPKTVLVWAVCGKCHDPTDLLMQHPVAAGDLLLQVRCGQCENCRLRKRAQWCARSVYEAAQAARTWFVTLTLKPVHAKDLLMRAIQFANAQGVDWAIQSTEARVRLMNSLMRDDLIKYRKRVRKASNGPFRFIEVVEPHLSKRGGGEHKGMPHWHLLVHEAVLHATSKQALRSSWKLGRTQAKLVRDDGGLDTCFYVAKYASKAGLGPPRRSRAYGRPRAALAAPKGTQ